MKLVLAAILLLLTSFSYASSVGNVKIVNIMVAGEVKVAIDNPPTDLTCSWYDRHFKFDATTDAGKNMLSTLIAAQLAEKPIAIWFSDSPTPGTDETNGCTVHNMAIANIIGLHN